MIKSYTWLTILPLATLAEINAAAKHKKVCAGAAEGLLHDFLVHPKYQTLRDRYINCTHVDGNLEIMSIAGDDLDFSFLKDITEVTGYVLIYAVKIRRLVLPNLTIIRGRNLYYIFGRKHALFIGWNAMETLELPALREISSGGVRFFDNPNLCYMNTINWEEILDDKSEYFENYKSKYTCPPCHETCEHGCWGLGPLNCQNFSKINCPPQCHQRRCFGPNPGECCHSFCAGGCSGPRESDCLFCKYFDDDGACREACPSKRRFNWTSHFWEINPDGKYAYGYRCVKSCPEHFLRDDGGCVRFCPEGKKDVGEECVSCDGPCPKSCKGVEVVQAGNIHTFKGCTIIKESVTIRYETFYGMEGVYDAGSNICELCDEECLAGCVGPEAHIMASVDHPNLLKLLAISMTARPKLVTALMPLGCLLTYVRSNKDKIGSKHLLSWCSQIARKLLTIGFSNAWWK